MPRKCAESPISFEPPRKKSSNSILNNVELKQGEIVSDNVGKQWKLGKAIGIGGFGEIYEVSEHGSKKCNTTSYVAKIEKHSNGPLFVEINCYLRLGKLDMINKWKDEKNLQFLGLPHFVASGSHLSKGEKYRFLIMPQYERDLEAIFQRKKVFNLKTVLVIASRIIDTLEYIHSHGYIHSDIKASNIMLGKQTINVKRSKSPVKRLPRKTRARPIARTCSRSLRPTGNLKYIDDIPYLDDVLNEHENGKYGNSHKTEVKHVASNDSINSDTAEFVADRIYLLDYGLASKYLLTNGSHREFCSDQRRAHAGTVLFCSRDAHKGIPSRRSDLESLAYNMIYWLTGTLPWVEDVHEPEIVEKKKNKCFNDVKTFLGICFEDCPRFLVEMFNYLSKLQFEDGPSYDFFRTLFKKTIKDFGYKDDSKLDFDNLEGWGRKQKKVKRVNRENRNIFKRFSILSYSPRIPLSSNILWKRPKLRKKIKDKLAKNSMMNWSKILVMDPENIIKQAHRRNTGYDDSGFNILDMDFESLNPTRAMREVINRASGREGYSPYGYRGDELCVEDSIEGYTQEMMRVYRRIKVQRELEFEKAVQNNCSTTKKRRGRRVKRSESPIRSSSRNVKNHRNDAMSTTKVVYQVRKVKSVPLKRVYSLRG